MNFNSRCKYENKIKRKAKMSENVISLLLCSLFLPSSLKKLKFQMFSCMETDCINELRIIQSTTKLHKESVVSQSSQSDRHCVYQ